MCPDKNHKVLIKKGPVSVETSLKEVEENYASKPEWKVIESGGMLSVPIEDFRMINPAKLDRSGQVDFGKKKGGQKHIDNYPVAQTTENLETLVLVKYNEVKEQARKPGTSTDQAEREAAAEAMKLPQFQAVKAWQDVNAEVKLKKALEKMMTRLRIPTLSMRSLNLKAISALKDPGLKLSGDAEIDLLMACVSRDLLHVDIFEVKRADTYPWQTKGAPPKKQAVNKAENQLTKDLDVMMAILAGIPPSQIVFQTFACFPDSSLSDLQSIICGSCLETGVVCQEDLEHLTLQQRKLHVSDVFDLDSANNLKHLLTLAARCLAHQSLLHVGYRDISDKENLVAEKHKFNTESVDGRLMQNEFAMASAQQQEVIKNFSSTTSTERHLVLRGPAGTGKTLVAMQVAKNILNSQNTADEYKEPVLVVTTHQMDRNVPLMKHFKINLASQTGTKVFGNWKELRSQYCIYRTDDRKEHDDRMMRLVEALAKEWPDQKVVLLVDEMRSSNMFKSLTDGKIDIPDSVTLILVANPEISASQVFDHLPPSFLQVELKIPYRSTIAITSLARFFAKSKGLPFPEGEFGSDVEGYKPILFDIGHDNDMLKDALSFCQQLLGNNVTMLHNHGRLAEWDGGKVIAAQGKEKGGPWNLYQAKKFYGCESDRVVVFVGFDSHVLEMITRARSQVILILYETFNGNYKKMQDIFQRAADQDLIHIKNL